MMAYDVRWSRRALKELASIERQQRAIVASWVNEHLQGSENPTQVGDCKRLRGVKNGWRWRVGRYRILGRLIDDELVIDLFRVGHRRDVYDNLPK